MDDPRNSLFMHYKSLLNEIKPNGFIFENVAGLLNMEKVRSLKESKKNSHQP
ncbi:DNA cytosine methyltransferase [Escherichia coli]|nr:DNA cytosine methyltransferase [Escherichia coli]